MDTLASNKAAALDFLRRCASGDVDAAYRLHVGTGFRHHNPYFRGDAASLQAGMRDSAAQQPGKQFDVQRAIAEGDLVAVHSSIRMQADALPMAVVHICRFDAGKLVELWDIGQPQPAECINEHGMF
jgi:predicted SnoaL-like aldol condensation-catalyzing enzyme